MKDFEIKSLEAENSAKKRFLEQQQGLTKDKSEVYKAESENSIDEVKQNSKN